MTLVNGRRKRESLEQNYNVVLCQWRNGGAVEDLDVVELQARKSDGSAPAWSVRIPSRGRTPGEPCSLHETNLLSFVILLLRHVLLTGCIVNNRTYSSRQYDSNCVPLAERSPCKTKGSVLSPTSVSTTWASVCVTFSRYTVNPLFIVSTQV